MKTYRYRNGAGWNRQKAVGQKMAFTLTETQRIEKYLLGLENWHDLALFSLGLDSFLRAGDLLALRVSDVTYSTGAVRSTLAKVQQKTKRGVFPELAPEVMDYVAHWIAISGKAITRAQYARVVKGWAVWLGHAPDSYSTHSIRRTKPVHMYWAGEKLSLISKLLGHKSEVATLEYLGITQKKAAEASRRHPMLMGHPDRPKRTAVSS